VRKIAKGKKTRSREDARPGGGRAGVRRGAENEHTHECDVTSVEKKKKRKYRKEE
jgi:hypothetical protein